MTKAKLAVASTITAAMILGSTIVFASSPATDEGANATDQTQQTEMLKPKPGGKRSGGAGFSLKK